MHLLLIIAFNLLSPFIDVHINEIVIAIEICTVSMDTYIMAHTLCSINLILKLLGGAKGNF